MRSISIRTKSVLDFIARNIVLLVLLFLAVYALGRHADVSMKTGLQVVFFEVIALLLSGIGAYVYTSFQFRKEMRSNEDDNRFFAAILLAAIFIGVHVCVGLCVLGIHFISWAPAGG